MSKDFDPEFYYRYSSLLKLLEKHFYFDNTVCISKGKQAVTNEIFKLGWLKNLNG